MAGYTQHTPLSQLLKSTRPTNEFEDKPKSSNDYRKAKDLEEQRKAGEAPAMIDVVSGKDINPHIPQFISQTPWYISTDGPTLQHQRPHPDRQRPDLDIGTWFNRGTTGEKATKFRKGACENCGVLTHQKKDCFERPRKRNAKAMNTAFAEDDNLQKHIKTMSYDAKRDRWNGYDPSMYDEVTKEFEDVEKTRELIQKEKLFNGEPINEEDTEVAEEGTPSTGVDLDSRTRITVRNLRIREDTAKYLHNLNENAPYYDPKSRSMRENPGADKDAMANGNFTGSDFERITGEVLAANQAQLFAWEARSKGIDINQSADPTKLEHMKKIFEKEKKEMNMGQREKILEIYGGREHLISSESDKVKKLLLHQNEDYAEYNTSGKVVKGRERTMITSKYEEDKYLNNHTSTWGSFWKSGEWGYKCCHSNIKLSYCVGEIGIKEESKP
uniref:Pre-mRNA-splicing factor SLU7 n=1 Tax=Rhabditophanes sp. KR3021 TaxID=114890 RepID=A0AC35UIL2_9BILA